jgi:hypothetical protein
MTHQPARCSLHEGPGALEVDEDVEAPPEDGGQGCRRVRSASQLRKLQGGSRPVPVPSAIVR